MQRNFQQSYTTSIGNICRLISKFACPHKNNAIMFNVYLFNIIHIYANKTHKMYDYNQQNQKVYLYCIWYFYTPITKLFNCSYNHSIIKGI